MVPALSPTTWARYRFQWGMRTFVMGILNITPDSFSGDGLAPNGIVTPSVIHAAVASAQRMVEDGADLIDVGGESSRPETVGTPPLTVDDERARVVPVIKALAAALPAHIPLSIDTYKASVAQAALDAGASMVNDIFGLRRDPEMASVVAERGVPVILMSNQRDEPRHDVVSDVIRQLSRSIELALAADIPWEHLIVDPGIGFGLKDAENLEILWRLNDLRALGRPILIGTSRKSIIGRVLDALPENDRLEGTAATVALAIARGADIVRVHDVRSMARVARMSDAVVRGWSP